MLHGKTDSKFMAWRMGAAADFNRGIESRLLQYERNGKDRRENMRYSRYRSLFYAMSAFYEKGEVFIFWFVFKIE